MLGIENLPVFIAACLLLNVTPGQDTVYIVTRSVAQGRRAGMVSVMGIMTGILVHTLLAALGLSALLAASAWAFALVKLLGAAYLVWLGLSMVLRARAEAVVDLATPAPQPLGVIYRQGLLTNLLNPKVALFFFSFLPQFVDPAVDSRMLSFMLLGGILFCTGSLWCLFLAYSAAAVTSRLRRGHASAAWLKRITGGIFMLLGLKLALSRGQ